MTDAYRVVQWNAHKKVYDLVVAIVCLAYVAVFVGVGYAVYPPPNDVAAPVLLMRALGTLSFVLLHVILLIGPLHRIDERFAPLLYNRRHLGVTMFVVALLHSVVAVGFYGGFGVTDPASALFLSYGWAGGVGAWPFEVFGLGALVILFVMAATSHDYWLAVLSPRVWKWLHMMVYGAYVLLVVHVALGAMQSERTLVYPVLLSVGAVALGGAHIAAGRKGPRRGVRPSASDDDGWIRIGSVRELTDAIPDSRGASVELPGGGRAAVFRDGDRLCAMADACAHQGGPLSEGKILDGCVTCPWHGYQYDACTGHSPPPYTERMRTYELRLRGEAVEMLVTPRPADSPALPLRIGEVTRG